METPATSYPGCPEEPSQARPTLTSRVAVVIPHFGDATPTRALVNALRDQVDVILVVDDGSPEPCGPINGADVIRREHNGGFGSAVNTGVAQVDTDLALVLNSDLEVGPTFIKDLTQAAAPWQPVVASPQIHNPDGRPEWVGRHFPTTSHQAVEWLTPLARWRHLPALHEAVGHDTHVADGLSTPVDWVIGAAMLIPVRQFREVGGFDERYFMNVEEVDLQRRLRAFGVPSVVLGTVYAIHEGGGSSDPARRRTWLVNSRLEYARTWGGLRRLRAALVAASAVNLCVNTSRRALGRTVDPLNVWREEIDLIRGTRTSSTPSVEHPTDTTGA